LRKEPIANEGTDNSYDEVADDSEPGALHDLPGQPSGNETDQQYDQETFARHVHLSILQCHQTAIGAIARGFLASQRDPLEAVQRRESQSRLWLKYNEDEAGRPHCLAKMISASDLGSNHRYDCQRAGIHDQNFIADQDIIIAAILRGIFQDRNRQIITMNCSWNNRADRG
jgi:hypothetical protein